MAKRVLYPSDADVEALCREAGVDAEFDSPEIVKLAFKLVQPTTFQAGKTLGFSPVPHRKCHTYFIETENERELSCTWEPPNAQQLKDQAREIERATRAKEAAHFGNLVEAKSIRKLEEEKVARKNALTRNALKSALLHYKTLLGSPEVDDVAEKDVGKRFWVTHPAMIKECARDVFGVDLSKEPELAWVIRQFCSMDLPSNWTLQEVGDPTLSMENLIQVWEKLNKEQVATTEAIDNLPKYVDLCFSFTVGTETEDEQESVVVDKHPGEEYFNLLIESVREEREIIGSEDSDDGEDGGDGEQTTHFEQMEEPFRRGILQFFHFSSQTYYTFNFKNDTVEMKGSLPKGKQGREGIPENLRALLNRGEEQLQVEFAKPETKHKKEQHHDVYTTQEVDALIEKVRKKDLWMLLQKRISGEELAAFATFCGVKLEGPDTDFLEDIARAFLGPLPDGWVKRVDPQGVEHYTCQVGQVEPKLFMALENATDVNFHVPNWAVKAHRMGLAVDVKWYACSIYHPAADACKIKFEKIRKQRQKQALQERIKARQESSEKKQLSRSNRAARSHEETGPRTQTKDALRDSYDYYVNIYGDPECVEDIVLPSSVNICTPDMVYSMAHHLFIGLDEPHLFWIAFMRLAVELPPGWQVDPSSQDETNPRYLSRCNSESIPQHPADAYFLAMATTAREKAFNDPSRESLEMRDGRGNFFIFNFRTKAVEHFQVAAQNRRNSRRTSGGFLHSKTLKQLAPSSPKNIDNTGRFEEPKETSQRPVLRKSSTTTISSLREISDAELQATFNISSPKHAKSTERVPSKLAKNEQRRQSLQSLLEREPSRMSIQTTFSLTPADLGQTVIVSSPTKKKQAEKKNEKSETKPQKETKKKKSTPSFGPLRSAQSTFTDDTDTDVARQLWSSFTPDNEQTVYWGEEDETFAETDSMLNVTDMLEGKFPKLTVPVNYRMFRQEQQRIDSLTVPTNLDQTTSQPELVLGRKGQQQNCLWGADTRYHAEEQSFNSKLLGAILATSQEQQDHSRKAAENLPRKHRFFETSKGTKSAKHHRRKSIPRTLEPLGENSKVNSSSGAIDRIVLKPEFTPSDLSSYALLKTRRNSLQKLITKNHTVPKPLFN